MDNPTADIKLHIEVIVSKPKKKKASKVSRIDHAGHHSSLASSSSARRDGVKDV